MGERSFRSDAGNIQKRYPGIASRKKGPSHGAFADSTGWRGARFSKKSAEET